MKAVILTGGWGERPSATDFAYRPTAPVLARPVTDYCLSLLAHHGVTEAYVTTRDPASQLCNRYGSEAFGLHLSYFFEKSPMGSCGGVKLLEEKLHREELFLVVRGDALCDFDPAEAIRFHREKKASATLILSRTKAPLKCGAARRCAAKDRVSFFEKPTWSQVLSRLAGSGVYILSPRVLEWVPRGKCFDFAADLFPLLLHKGLAVFGYKDREDWCDLGKLSALYSQG